MGVGLNTVLRHLKVSVQREPY
ncbi:hypothetical protein [Klebsiella quasipneumoniae]